MYFRLESIFSLALKIGKLVIWNTKTEKSLYILRKRGKMIWELINVVTGFVKSKLTM